MFRLYVRISLILLCLVCLVLLTVMAVRVGSTATALVYSQFARAQGRYFVYVDPLTGIHARVQRPYEDMEIVPNRSLSPDGQTYVAAYPTIDGVDLFAFDMGAGTYRQLTSAAAFDGVGQRGMRSNTYPVWSPDGEWIAFVSSDLRASVDVFVISADGQRLLRVARDVSTPGPLLLRWGRLEERPFQPLPLLLTLFILAGLAYPRRSQPPGTTEPIAIKEKISTSWQK
jgi:hypothetical protein